MKKKVVCFIGGSYVSGLEIVTLHLLAGLKAQGCEILCIISGWNDGVFKRKLSEQGIDYREIKLGWIHLRKPLWTLDTLWHYPAAYNQVRKILKEFKPDVAHVCSYAFVIMLYPLFKFPTVYNLQEPHEPTRKHLSLYRRIDKKISRYTAVSNAIVKVLKGLNVPAHKIALIYNGVPVAASRQVTQVSLPLRLAIVGQVAEWKGHHTLVDAVALVLKNRDVALEVLIYGNDKNEYAERLKKTISEKKLSQYFQWKGFVKNQEEIYSNVDVVVVPSLSQEPCSLTIIESMMRGKAVIASDRGGNPELVQHGYSGLIFEADSATSLFTQMEVLVNDPGKILQLSKNACKEATEKLTVDRMVNEYMELYNSL